MLPRLLAATAQFDVTRHRGELDDGHLSPRQHILYICMYTPLAQAAQGPAATPTCTPAPALTLTLTLALALAPALTLSRQRKAQLRAVLLNDSGLAAQLTSWRRVAGYDASFAAHCVRYGYKYHEESAAILGSTGPLSITGPGMGVPMGLRL